MKRIAALLIIALLFSSLSVHGAHDFVILPGEDGQPPIVTDGDSDILPEIELSGTSDAASRLENMQFSDLVPGDSEEANAAFYLASLGILSGGKFRPDDQLTHTEAIAFIYKAFGDPDIIEAADTEVKQKREAQLSLSAVDSWADGYYLCAMRDGLISSDEFDQAFLEKGNFQKHGPATRQEVLAWCAKLIKIVPASKIFVLKRYFDFNLMSSEVQSYVEPLVRLGIIGGSDRMLLPNQHVTRRQMALILSRFDGYFKPAVTRHYGTVKVLDKDNRGTYLDIYTDNLRYDRIYFDAHNGDFPVFGHSGTGLSTLVQPGDEVCYWYHDEKNIIGMQILSSENEKKEFVVSDIYRGSLYLYDTYTDHVILKDAQRYENEMWLAAGDQLFTDIPVADNPYLYHNDVQIEKNAMNERYLDRSVYVIVGHYTGGGNDQALYINIR